MIREAPANRSAAPARAPDTRAPIDELDDDGSGGVAGPIYRDDSQPNPRTGGTPR